MREARFLRSSRPAAIDERTSDGRHPHPPAGEGASRSTVPRPSTVIACIALAVALGGTGYAAIALPAGSVGTAQLKNGAVVSSKVKDGSLRARDFAAGELPAGE